MSQSYRLTKHNRQKLLDFIGRLDLAKDWVVTVEPFVKRRTNTQNARWWLLLSRAAEVTGYSVEELHEIALCRFFGTKEIEVGGITALVPLKRSSSRNTQEFAELMTSTEEWLMEKLGVWLE